MLKNSIPTSRRLFNHTLSFTKLPKRNFITVINQAEVAYREFLGRNRVKLQPGLRIKLPILHNLHRVDMRETGMYIPSLKAYTSDNVPVSISGSLFFKISDPEKACFKVVSYYDSISAVGQSSTRSLIGKFDYDQIIAKRNEINIELVSIIGKTIDEWGISCTRFEIQEFRPQNDHIAKQLEKQMEAERSRRENELNTQANIRTAEGEKKAAIYKADAELYSQQKQAEAKSYAIDTITKAMSEQINTIGKMLGSNSMAVEYILETERLKNLNAISQGNNKTIYFVDPHSMIPSSKIFSDIINENKKM